MSFTDYDPRAYGARCDVCPLFCGRPVPTEGPRGAPLVIVGEAPGREEVEQRRPFVGASGELINTMIDRIDGDRSQYRITNTVLCRPPSGQSMKDFLADTRRRNKERTKVLDRWQKEIQKIERRNEKALQRWEERCRKIKEKNATPLKSGRQRKQKPLPVKPESQELPDRPAVPDPDPMPADCCRKRLEHDVAGSVIFLLLGNEALFAFTGLTGVKKYTNSVLRLDEERTAIVCVHPAMILRGAEAYSQALCSAVERAVRFARDGVPEPTQYRVVWRDIELHRELRTLSEAATSDRPIQVAVDVETNGLRPEWDHLRCVGLAYAGICLVVPTELRDGNPAPTSRATLMLLRQVLTHPGVVQIYHNGQFDRRVLMRWLVRPKGPSHDTLLAHHAWMSEQPHNLDFVAATALDTTYWKDEAKGSGGLLDITDEELWQYNAKDTQATLEVLPRVLEMVDGSGARLVYEQAVALQPIIADMGANGILVDLEEQQSQAERLREIEERCVAEMRGAVKEAYDTLSDLARDVLDVAGVVPDEYEYSKILHTQAVLKALGIETPRTGVSRRRSTQADHLMAAALSATPLARRYIGNRSDGDVTPHGRLGAIEAGKVISTFIFPRVDLDGRVRASWSQHTTPTGRLASSGPNLQNIPKAVRALYVTAPGHVFVAADYSALELWIIAILSGAQNLLDALRSSDVHRANAEGLFELDFAAEIEAAARKAHCPRHTTPPELAVHDGGKKIDVEVRGCDRCASQIAAAVDSRKEELYALRQLAKRYVYGSNYGASDTTLWLKLVPHFPDLQVQHVADLRHRWQRVNPELAVLINRNHGRYLERRNKSSSGHGYLESPIMGRRRYWIGVEFGPSDAANYPVQSAAGDIINTALLRLYAAACIRGAKLVAQVHDSLVFEVPEHQVERMRALLESVMPGPYEFREGLGSWSFPVESNVGTRWSEV